MRRQGLEPRTRGLRGSRPQISRPLRRCRRLLIGGLTGTGAAAGIPETSQQSDPGLLIASHDGYCPCALVPGDAFDALAQGGRLQMIWSAPIGTASELSVSVTDSGRVYVGTGDGYVIGVGA